MRCRQQTFVSKCCRRAFVRGCFLASGSISAPQKGYHFEIVTVSEASATTATDHTHLWIEAKTVVRKKYHVVYAKEGEQIGDLLSLMEAPKARMNFENIRILKDVRNSVNRKVNCEAANLNKTANASLEQVRDIEYISEYYGLESLPENLRQAARLRLEKPDASLTELGKMMDPPVSKSGVNHRFKKLKALADQMREKGGRL
ncbi:MAG: DNA-binding protein WhiA [Lachnospiraceae bacterium]